MMTEYERNFNGFAAWLRVAAFANALVCLIAGIVLANETRGSGYYSYEYFNPSILFMWILGGAMSFMVWWSLSYIVAACDKYLKNNK